MNENEVNPVEIILPQIPVRANILAAAVVLRIYERKDAARPYDI